MPPQVNQSPQNQKEDVQRAHDRFVTIGWALFLILIGVIWLVPKDVIPEGSFFIGVGAILLGLTLAKLLVGLKTDATVIFLGIIALAIGFRNLLELQVPIIPIIIIILGSFILFVTLFRKRQE